MNTTNKKTVKTVIGIAVLVLLCLCCATACLIGILIYRMPSLTQSLSTTIPTLQAQSPLNTEAPQVEVPISPTVPPETRPTTEQAATETRDKLNQMLVPEADAVDLAERLRGKVNVPETLIDTGAPYAVGAKKAFWVMDTDTTETRSAEAVLRYVGDNVYIWIEEQVKFKEASVTKLGNIIDQDIVPTNRGFFGTEWNPGVDGDPRFYILYVRGLGSTVAGYYSSSDEVHPDAHPYSNAHEMFLINADSVKLEDHYILGTIAHEYQHMIHWYLDKNEETWVNEGFSMLAEQVNNYSPGGFDWNYMQNTDMQLNDWSTGDSDNSAHYGASYLFMSYYLDRFGEEATKKLVAHKENGFIAMDSVAKELNLINPDTQKPYTGEEIFSDWSVANLLQKSGIANRRYDYKSHSPYKMNLTEALYSCPQKIQRDVHQFGVDSIKLECNNVKSFTFKGEPFVKVIPVDQAPSGDYFYWSNIGDESNSSLTRDFDLSQATGESKLKFKAWYDIEVDYDYAYVSATTDGQNWTIIDSKTCATDNPSGNSFGCGWTGKSKGWIDEEVDLSAYNGKVVTLRFDYVTDAAVHSHGLALDNFNLESIGYSEDLEENEGAWNGQGFVRIQNVLPQTYVVSVIRYGSQTTVEHHFVKGDDALTITLEKTPNEENVVILVSGSSLGTRQKAKYQISFTE